MAATNNIESATPAWAARCYLFLNGIYGFIVFLQEKDVIDILPIDPVKKDRAKAIVSVAVVVGGVYFVSRNKKGPLPTAQAGPTVKAALS